MKFPSKLKTTRPAVQPKVQHETGTPGDQKVNKAVTEATTTAQKADASLDASQQALADVEANTKSLLQHTADQGQGFVGQKTANASSSPALRGFNLTVPSDLKVFDKVIGAIDNIIGQAAAGTLDKAGVDQALAQLPETSHQEASALWAPSGQSKRTEVNAAFDRLAQALPDATVGTMKAAETAKWNKVMDADFKGDQNTVGKLAGELLQDFPNSALAQTYEAYAQRSAATPDHAFQAPTFSNADEVIGVLTRVANKGGDGISGAKGSLSDAELRFMADLVDASRSERDLPMPPANVDVDNIKDMCTTFSTMGAFGNHEGKIQEADFIGIRQLAQKSADTHMVLEHHASKASSSFSDADQVKGVLTRLANQGGDGISGAKGSLSDAELRFMADLVDAGAKGASLPAPPADVDVDNIKDMCTTFSTMGAFGNHEGKIQEADFIAIKDLAEQSQAQVD